MWVNAKLCPILSLFFFFIFRVKIVQMLLAAAQSTTWYFLCKEVGRDNWNFFHVERKKNLFIPHLSSFDAHQKNVHQTTRVVSRCTQKKICVWWGAQQVFSRRVGKKKCTNHAQHIIDFIIVIFSPSWTRENYVIFTRKSRACQTHIWGINKMNFWCHPTKTSSLSFIIVENQASNSSSHHHASIEPRHHRADKESQA